MTPTRRRTSHAPDGAAQHRSWLGLIEVTGPFLSLPVLRRAWPTLDALEKPMREALRREHASWQDDSVAGRDSWVRWVQTGLLGWGSELREDAEELHAVSMEVAEHETEVVPTFAVVEPGEDVKPATTRLIGLVLPAGQSPTARVPGSTWAATPADRVAALCRHHGVELGLVTDGRRWALVWARKDQATGVAVFDTVAWPEAAERDVVRAFLSLLTRSRFFGVRDDERLPALLHASLGSQEDITEALGSQVREAVELLVAALGRLDLEARERGAPSLEKVDAHDVYRGAVSVMMRIVFLLFAEERRLLPADNDLYRTAYSAGTLLGDLEQRVSEGSEDDLEYTSVAWHRLMALFTAVHDGIDHPRLTIYAHDGSLFDPSEYPWLDMPVDDRTVLHMLRAVQTVEIGSGRLKERRSLSFRSLGVEEIGYVYEGLLAYDAFRAADVVLGLVGKRGQEAEVELRELESFAPAHCGNVDTLAADITRRYAKHGMGASPSVAKKLKPPSGAAAEAARRKLLGAAEGDAALVDRLTPFFGILRLDLRGLPMVIQAGALYVTDSPRRRNTGTHYTPRELAEEVVLHALQPLVYEPGPLETADEGEWKLKSAEQILALNVADIAMGSAAFLVAAARYLGARLIEAWTREGDARAQAYSVSDMQSEEDSLVIEARRTVIEHCLYGVDVNPMAVEMAKLSLWLVTMDPVRPFTFLDDRLVAGDSLLGITSLEQLEYMNIDPIAGRRAHQDLFGWASSLRGLEREAARERERLVALELGGPPLERLNEKRAILFDAWSKLGRAKLCADLLIGAYLSSRSSLAGGSLQGTLVEASRIAEAAMSTGSERELRQVSRSWLDNSLPDGHASRRPIHWPLIFPEVMMKGGFDAVVGNPPFLGGSKISGTWGSSYREGLVNLVAGGLRGNSDLVGYFLRRSAAVLSPSGGLGVVATTSLSEGDTREVGLDPILDDGFSIRKAMSGAEWPARSASIRFCAVWAGRVRSATSPVLDGHEVSRITPALVAEQRAHSRAYRLLLNCKIGFQGAKIDGIGFVISEEGARSMISSDPRYREVLFPFLNGSDLNESPTYRASRWVVNFHDWDEEKAKSYPSAYSKAYCDVRPTRLNNNRKLYRERWWQYAERRPGMQAAIGHREEVLALTLHTKALVPARVPTGQVFSHALAVFATDSFRDQAILSSSFHLLWAIKQSSSLGTSIRYTLSDVFETFPQPDDGGGELDSLGKLLRNTQATALEDRQCGLTHIYNLVSSSDCADEDVVALRELHRAIDVEMVRNYGWFDRFAHLGGLDHGFHKVGRETRFTLGPAAQREVLDSLLELNHERHAEEVAQGLHDKKRGGRAKKTAQAQEGMFDAD